MSAYQYITELESQLTIAKDAMAEADILKNILYKYSLEGDNTGAHYIERLREIAIQSGSKDCQAWATYFGDYEALLSGNYKLDDVANSLSLFTNLNDLKGIASAYMLAGNAYLYAGDHDNALTNYLASLEIREDNMDSYPSKVHDEKSRRANLHYNVAFVYTNQGKYNESLSNHFAALNLRDQIGDVAGTGDSNGNIAIIYTNIGRYADALLYADKCLKIWEQLGDKRKIAASHQNISVIYYYQGRYNDSLTSLDAALKLYEEIDDKQGIAGVSNNMGDIYSKQGNYPGALSILFYALKLYEELNGKNGIAHCYNNIGDIYLNQGEYADALSGYSAAQQLYEEIGDKQHIITTHNAIGSLYLNQRDYAKALTSHFAALQIARDTGDEPGLANTSNNIGNVYLAEGEYNAALTRFFEAVKIKEATGNKGNIAGSYTAIGQCYTGLKQYKSAETWLLKGLDVAQEIGAKEDTRIVLRALYELKKAEDNNKAALAYIEQFIEVEKELNNTASAKKIADLHYGHQIDRKEQEVTFERQKKEALQVAYDLLDKEKERSESLLLNILPAEVAEELKEKGVAKAKLFDNVTVLFTDFKGFTTVSEKLSPEELVNELHTCFKGFDKIVGKYNIEKIKTVGDAYLAVCGLPVANPNHSTDMVRAALEIRDFMLAHKKQNPDSFEVRIGVHSGRCVAGIVGVKKFAYDIWGDTVNTAARMEQNGEAGKVNISEDTYQLVKDKFKCTFRGEIAAKNKGKLRMYFVE